MNWYDVDEHGRYIKNNIDGCFALRYDVEPFLNNFQQINNEITNIVNDFSNIRDDIPINNLYGELFLDLLNRIRQLSSINKY